MKMMKGLVLSLMLIPLLAFGQQRPPPEDLFPRNNDIRQVARMINVMAFEINNAASTATTGVQNADLNRWKEYSVSLRAYVDWAKAQPAPLDMPRTWDLVTDVAPAPEVVPTNNFTADDLVTWLILERYELIKGQSSGASSGFTDDDYDRFMAVMDRYDSRIALAETGAVIDVPQTLSNLGGSAPASTRGIVLP